MQGWYGQAIRNNKGDAKAMSKATHAILKHCSSTLENPNHGDCPTEKSSWCSFQRDIASGTELQKKEKARQGTGGHCRVPVIRGSKDQEEEAEEVQSKEARCLCKS